MTQTEWASGSEPEHAQPPQGLASLARALTRGTPQRVGWYRLYFDDERWEWSPELEQIYGYQPGTVIPTTHLVLSHRHPDDQKQVAATFHDIRGVAAFFSTCRRIITAQSTTREVVVMWELLRDDIGEVVGTQGFYIDLTATGEASGVNAGRDVSELTDHRIAIEQAKGILMYVYHVDADAAFDVLKWRSDEMNAHLAVFTEQLLADVYTMRTESPTYGSIFEFDRLLLTTHQRIRPTPARKGSYPDAP